MGAVFAITQELEHCGECPTCGISFAAPSNFMRVHARQHGRDVYCPNGHTMTFGKDTEVVRLKRELEAKERALTWEREAKERAFQREEAAKRSAAAARGQVTKIRNRVGNGVCPCCNRFFVALSRHMTTKHPDFKNEET